MTEEFYCILKLVSGEEILSLISIDDNGGDPIIILQNPVVMELIDSQMKSYVKIKPWMELPSDDLYLIKLDKVITMTETTDKKLIGIYCRYLNDDDDDINVYKSSGEVKISNQMGYVSSVEDARNNLEELYKDTKGS
jgi:hypothetical protein